MSDASSILTFDDVLPDPLAYRATALAQPFGDAQAYGVTFHGIAPAPDEQFRAWMEAQFGDIGTVLTFLRLSPEGQTEPNYIHDDRSMGLWTAILYLTPDPPDDDGTTFWRRKDTGATASQTDDPAEKVADYAAWRALDLWEPWHRVQAKFNRVLMFPGAYYHSRTLAANYGTSPTTARLVQIMFGGPTCLSA